MGTRPLQGRANMYCLSKGMADGHCPPRPDPLGAACQQAPPTGTGKTQPWAPARLTIGTGKAIHGQGHVVPPFNGHKHLVLPVNGYGHRHPCSWQSQVSPTTAPSPRGNRQWADQRHIHTRILDRLPDCQATDRHARATRPLYCNVALNTNI